ncbi:MAG: low specificity L-threonine aldolase, partial [Candidatus Eisenbacteria bacterium]|nr:low specificity L-threonine aldolase [Candidatus Eisenbacteria bacterium]
AARRVRKRWGGGMRQAGILAAACLHALDHHIARLADDHARARRLAEGFAQAPGVSVPKPDTNIVIADLEPGAPDAATVVAALAERGVRTVPFGPRRVRAIAHLDVDDAGVERAIGAFREVLTQAVGAAR